MARAVPIVLVAAIPFWLAGIASGGDQRAGPAASSERDAMWREIFRRPGEDANGPVGAAETARRTLGQHLFEDKRLSADGRRSCASCHRPELGFTDGRTRGLGRDGRPLARNVPSLYNLAEATTFFWDGRAASLEEQARHPILHHNELAATFPSIADRLQGDPEMRRLFAAAFPSDGPVGESQIVGAISAYERSLVSPKTRFDRWVEGDDAALSAPERDGLAIFVGKGGCVACHGGWRFTDGELHDIGLPLAGSCCRDSAVLSVGQQFKTPSLRRITLTAPYMHDGSLPTLGAVVDHYTGGLLLRPSVAPNVVRNLMLAPEEKQALVAFLQTL